MSALAKRRPFVASTSHVGTAPSGPYFCRIKGCPGASIAYDSKGALGSHRRRKHGIVAIAKIIKRPAGGTIFCDVPGCMEKLPYVTMGGLGQHKRSKHRIVSTTIPALKKDQWRKQHRAKRAGEPQEPARRPRGRRPPPPAAADMLAYVPAGRWIGIDRGRREDLRKRLLYVVNATWAAEFNSSPAELRDAIQELCESNFEPPQRPTTATG